jgi:hypothetical protein
MLVWKFVSVIFVVSALCLAWNRFWIIFNELYSGFEPPLTISNKIHLSFELGMLLMLAFLIGYDSIFRS